MKTKEVEQITGLSRQTLIWYEKEGLIHPERKENNYREYSEKDVQLLQIIKMLRNMDISIDDIRQFLEKHTSVEELLEEQKAHLKREQEQLKSTEETVHFYADTRAPILEGLQEMYEPRISWLGKEQPPEPFHIGVRPDRKRVKKLIRWNISWLILMVFLVCIFAFNFERIWNRSIPLWILMGWITIIIILALFGFGIPQIGIGNSLYRYLEYAELSREGIFYIKADTFADKLCFLWNSLRQKELLAFMPYEQIKKVTILHTVKYMSIFSSPFAYELSMTSFIFTFRNGTSCSIFNRMFYGNDEEIIIRILKEKVKNVQIKDEIYSGRKNF